MISNTFKPFILLFITMMFFSNLTFAQQNNKGGRPEPPSAEELIKQMDKDKDGKLSKKEIAGPIKKDFDKIDENKDGFLTKKELEKAPKPKTREER